MILEKNIDNNFFETINILNSNNINYWICHGTLLGIIREGKLIEWDHDIDIAIWSDEIPKNLIIELMKKNDFKLRDGFGVDDDLVSFDKNKGRTVDFSFLRRKFINDEEVAYVTYFLPKNTLMKIIEAFSSADKYSAKFKTIINLFSPFRFIFKTMKKFLIRTGVYYKGVSLYVPAYLLKKTDTKKINDLKIKIPLLFDDYLNFVYGKNWRIPKKNHIWPKDYKTF